MTAVVTANAAVITDSLPGTVRRDAGLSGDALDFPQLVQNPDFEVDLANWTFGANTTQSRITTDHYSGTACCQLVMAASSTNRYARAVLSNVRPNVPLVLVINAKITAGTYIAGLLQLLAADQVTVLKQYSLVGSGDWQQWALTASIAELAGSTTCYLNFTDAPDATIRTWTIDLASAQPPQDNSFFTGPAPVIIRANRFQNNVTGYTGTNATIAQDAAIGEFGTSLTATLTAGLGQFRTPGDALVATAQYTVGVQLTLPVGKTVVLKAVRADLVTVFATSAVLVATGAPQLAALTFTAPASETEYIFITDTSNTTYGIRLHYLQLETGPIANPFVGEAGARAAGTLTYPIQNFLSPIQWAIAFCAELPWPSAAGPATPYVLTLGSSGNNRVEINYSGTQWNCHVTVNGSAGASLLVTDAWTAAQAPAMRIMIVGQLANGTLYFSVGGSGFFTTVTFWSNAIIAGATFYWGSFFSASNWLSGRVYWIATFTGLVTGIVPANINAYGKTAPTLARLASDNPGSSPTSVWQANTLQIVDQPAAASGTWQNDTPATAASVWNPAA